MCVPDSMLLEKTIVIGTFTCTYDSDTCSCVVACEITLMKFGFVFVCEPIPDWGIGLKISLAYIPQGCRASPRSWYLPVSARVRGGALVVT